MDRDDEAPKMVDTIRTWPTLSHGPAPAVRPDASDLGTVRPGAAHAPEALGGHAPHALPVPAPLAAEAFALPTLNLQAELTAPPAAAVAFPSPVEELALAPLPANAASAAASASLPSITAAMAASAQTSAQAAAPPPAFAFDAGPTAPPVPDVRQRAWPRRLLRAAAYGVAAWLGLTLLLMLAYRFVNPPMSALMLQQRIFGQEIYKEWVSLDQISPQVIRAVVVSEDGRFCQHSGIDYDAMQDAIERVGEGAPRGASTISMQVVKNLFLWPSKSYVRKAIELPLTLLMELIWPKDRIMEVYLNIAEWGPGIFGVEAASQFHFNKSARKLNEREAARLAVALPNPLLRDAGEPGPRTLRLAEDIQGRMRNASGSQMACVLRR